MDRRAWWATVHGVVKSQTRLEQLCPEAACTMHCMPSTHRDSPGESGQKSLLLWHFAVGTYFLRNQAMERQINNFVVTHVG